MAIYGVHSQSYVAFGQDGEGDLHFDSFHVRGEISEDRAIQMVRDNCDKKLDMIEVRIRRCNEND